MNTRTAVYARISTRERGQDTQNQLHQLREFAARQGWIIVNEFVDHESGSTDDRKQFQAMFEAASRRQFDVLLYWSLDRFSREGVFETLIHLNRLTGYGVHYRTFTEQWFDSFGSRRALRLALNGHAVKGRPSGGQRLRSTPTRFGNLGREVFHGLRSRSKHESHELHASGLAKLKKWSGDHCASDPSNTQGVFFSNRALVDPKPTIFDTAPTVLQLLRVPPPGPLDGSALPLGSGALY